MKSNKKNKKNQKPKKKSTLFAERGFKIVVISTIILFILNITSHYFKNQKTFKVSGPFLRKMTQIFNDPILVFLEHSWIELTVALFVFVALERTITRRFAIPKGLGKRDHHKILESLKNPDENVELVRILDISIFEYFTSKVDFVEAIKGVIEYSKGKYKVKIEILLMHPGWFYYDHSKRGITTTAMKYLENMKAGILKLYNDLEQITEDYSKPVEKIKYDVDVQARLYRTKPILTFASWGTNANFAPYFGDDTDLTFLGSTETDLGKSFQDYFKSLWGDENDSSDFSRRPIKISDYLYLTITELGEKEMIYWGGRNSDYEKPRYILAYGERQAAKFKECFTDDLWIELWHNNRLTKAKLRSVFKNENENEYDYAYQKVIQKYGDVLSNYNKVEIYELQYFYEHGINIKLTQIDFVNKQIAKYGFCYVSHKQYDLNLSNKVQKFLHAFHSLTENDLEPDIHEKNSIDEINSQISDYKNNPRSRLFLQFACDTNLEIIKCEIIEDSKIYTSEFIIKFKEKTSTRLIQRDYKSIKERISEVDKELQVVQNNIKVSVKDNLKKLLLEENKLLGRKENFKTIQMYVRSIIMADLIYLLGEFEFLKENSKFIVNANIIRTEVGIENGLLDSAYPTPQGFSKSNSEYQVIHLINRENISGGITKISLKDDPEKDTEVNSFLLNKPMDSLYFKNKICIEGVDYDVSHYTDEISLINNPDSVHVKGKDNKKHGFRDVLVLEFKKN